MVSIEHFKELELVVAEIKEVQVHPNADRLYVLKISIGEEERQLVAGIRRSYSEEELVGRKVVVVKNIAPATIRGEESQGMLLAASDDQGMSILTPDKEVAIGSPVK